MGTVSSKRGSMEVRRQKDDIPQPPVSIVKPSDEVETPDHECSPPLINYVNKDVNERDDKGRTHLHTALVHGADNECIIVQLIRMGCDPNASDNLGLKPLHVAAGRNYINCMAKLLAAKVEIDPQDNEGHTPFMLACQGNCTNAATLLLNRGAQLNAETKSGRTALHLAAASGSNDCVQLLLDRKARPNIRDKDNNSALMLACHYGQEEATELLLRKNAKTSLANKDGKTALHLATESGSKECVHALIDASVELDISDVEGETAFVCAIKADQARILKLLLDAGCDSTSIDGLNGTALGLATIHKSVSCVRVLLEAGEDPDEFGFCGLTPLMCSINDASTNITITLLDSNANPNTVARNGLTALVKGLKHINPENQAEIYKGMILLLRANAYVNQDITLMGLFANFCPMGRQCAMALAVATGILASVRILAIAGSDVNYFTVQYWSMRDVFSGNHACYNRVLGDSKAVKSFLDGWTACPRALSHLCRIKMRSLIPGTGRKYVNNLRKLPIPERLLDYLNLSELESLIPDKKAKSYMGFENYNGNFCRV